jgi:hypothetical protein
VELGLFKDAETPVLAAAVPIDSCGDFPDEHSIALHSDGTISLPETQCCEIALDELLEVHGLLKKARMN